MPKIIFIDTYGVVREAEGRLGETAMEVARKHSIPEINGDCGGAAACANCHVYVDTAFADILTPAETRETVMLSFCPDQRSDSRLACQIQLTSELHGLTLWSAAKARTESE